MLRVGKGNIKELEKIMRGRPAVIVTDETVKKLHLSKLLGITGRQLIFVIPSGEQSKSRKMKEKIEDFLLENSCGKDTVLIAFGGGVVSDLTGYVAATYKRGISYINVPTTLLGMVDAGVGGKTGINTTHGKNLIGAIWQPEAVISDIAFLETLPNEEMKNGMAEVIKTAIILDKKLFELLEKTDLNERDLIKIIEKCSSLKMGIVKKDSHDKGIRNLLNFGHTIGHAIESCSNYSIKHGFAVSIGIAIESRISRDFDILKDSEYERIVALLKKTGLPTDIPTLNTARFKQSINNDKKRSSNKLKIILIEKIGKARLTEIAPELFFKVIE